MTAKVRSRRVLVVEDDPGWARDMFQWVLEDLCKCQVEVASDLDAARRILDKEPHFDLLVVDVSLSEQDSENTDGLRLLEQANRKGLRIPAIIVSGRGAQRISDIGLEELGVREYVRKERFKPQEFSLAVDAILGPAPASKPVQPHPDAPPAGEPSDLDRPEEKKVAGRVLVVDDEEVWREDVLAFHLREEGYDVQTAQSYDEALAKIEAHTFDVAIVDLNLSEQDPIAKGWVLLSRIRRRSPETKVIVISGQPVTGDDMEKALDYRVSGFVQKGRGFKAGDLFAKVQEAIRSRPGKTQVQRVEDRSRRGGDRAVPIRDTYGDTYGQAQATIETRQEIEGLVRQGRLEEALEKLCDVEPYRDKANVLLSRLSRAQREQRQGKITQEQAETTYTRIAEAILDLI